MHASVGFEHGMVMSVIERGICSGQGYQVSALHSPPCYSPSSFTIYSTARFVRERHASSPWPILRTVVQIFWEQLLAQLCELWGAVLGAGFDQHCVAGGNRGNHRLDRELERACERSGVYVESASTKTTEPAKSACMA